MIVPRTAIGDFVNHDWVACCDRHARRTKRLWFISHQETPLFAVTAFIMGFAANCGGWKIRCVRGRGKRTMPEA